MPRDETPRNSEPTGDAAGAAGQDDPTGVWPGDTPGDPTWSRADGATHMIGPLTSGDSRLSPGMGGSADDRSRFGARYVGDAPPVARGGMGEVFAVWDTTLGRNVAIKRLLERYRDNPAMVGRFLEEARIAAGLDHPNTIAIHDLYPYAQLPFYAMPLLEGQTLHDAIRDHHRGASGLALRGLVEAFRDVCNAIAHAHARGVLHRDLKGSNIYLGSLGRTIVIDWGLATRQGGKDVLGRAADPLDSDERRAASYAPSSPGQAIGTVAYMASEQAAGDLDRIDRRSDVFGLGAILYAILAGRGPYSGCSHSEGIRRAIAAEFTPPSVLVPGTPTALEAICLKAMQRRPEDRYQTAEELAEDIRLWLADEPVSAYREPFPARAGRWARKHQPIVAGAAMLLVTAIVGLSLGIWRVSVERDRTDRERIAANIAKDKARTAADRTWSVLDRTLLRIEAGLPHVPGTEALRLDTAREAMEAGNQIARAAPDDREAQYRSALPIHRVANLYRMRHDDDAARMYYDQGVALLERLDRDHPGDRACGRALASLWVDRAELSHLIGQHRAARADLDRALARARDLASVPNPEIRDRELLAKALLHLALILGEMGVDDESNALFAEAWSLPESAEADSVSADRMRLRRVLVGGNWAQSLRRQGKIADAEARSNDALTAAIELRASGPASDNDREFLLAYARMQAGRVLLRRPDGAPEAAVAFDAAAASLQGLARSYPDVVPYRDSLAEARIGRGLARAALAASDRGATSRAWRLGLAESDLRQAIAGYEDLARRHPRSANFLAQLGRAHAGLSEALRLRGESVPASEARGRAIEALRKSVNLGPDDREARDDLRRIERDE